MLTTGDKKWIKNAIVEGVVEGTNQVMIPYSEEQEKRYDKKMGDLGKDLKIDFNNGIGKLGRKLDAVTDHHSEKLDNHERRIGKLELAVS